MPQVPTIEDPLLRAWSETQAQRRNNPAILDPQREAVASFDQIETLSHQYDEAVATLAPGEVLAIQLGNHSHWPALLLACLRRRVVVLPLEQSIGEQERVAALQTCRVSGLISDPAQGVERFQIGDPISWGEDPPVLLKLTSGTTAAPRAIRFRSAQLLADAVQICETMGITSADLNFGVIPFSHSYGFSNLVTPLLVRGVPLVLSSDRLPRAVLADLARTEATVFPGMPLFYQAFCEIKDAPALPKLRLCISAGAPLGRQVAQSFREKFGQPIHSFYGASECGGICYDRLAVDQREGFVGPAMQGVELTVTSAGMDGTQVRVRSAAVGDGYFPEPEPGRLGGGTFLPDDLVTLGKDGLQLVGRISDVINVAGKKVNPAEVEAHLLSHRAIQQAVVFGRDSTMRNQEVIACVVTGASTDESHLLEFCRAGLSAWQVPKRIFFLDAIPVNERGKVSRRELAVRFGKSGQRPFQ